MNVHNRVTADDEVAVCPECDTGGIGLASPGSMQHDEPAGKRYWCPKCGAGSKVSRSVLVMTDTRTGERQCERAVVCGSYCSVRQNSIIRREKRRCIVVYDGAHK